MYNFIVCSVFKNESHILDEWISHYLYHGVEHIYLVNDFSNDNFIDILNQYSDKITLFNNDIITTDVGRQTLIYDKYFKPMLSHSKWMTILDMDEFLYSPHEINIQLTLELYDQYSQIIVAWVHFGSNDHVLQPNSVVEGFTMRAFYGRGKQYYGYKSIFKTDSLIDFGIHKNSIKGKEIHLQYTDHVEKPSLLLNHYNLQSFEFFSNVKSKRGDINNWFDHQNLKRDGEYFKKHDDNDVEDLMLCRQNKPIINDIKMKKISDTDSTFDTTTIF